MLIFATVNWRNYLGRGVEYTNILHDSVHRNLKEGTKGKFVVFTDNPNEEGYADGIERRILPEKSLIGWMNKLQLFRSDAFDKGDRIIYLDLDTVITGSLDEIAAYSGPFAILRDAYRPNGLQSSVMMWEAGKYTGLWGLYKIADFPNIEGGDQAWIEKWLGSGGAKPVIIQETFPGKFCSYKKDARFGIPPGTSVVFFHGNPRPHEADGWVPHLWKVGGASASQLELVGNTDIETIRSNIERAEVSRETFLTPVPEHEHVAIICAGGPSLKDEIASVQAHARSGAHIFACNGVPRLLRAFGVTTDLHVVLDARPENAQFTEGLSENTVCLYASQCDKSVHEAAGDRLILWHPAFEGVLDIVGLDKERTYIGGGTTCGMKAVVLAWTLGYREIHLYGFDSCYKGDEHHAYPQSLNDKELVFDTEYNGKTYKCASWMIQQAEDFQTFGPQLMDCDAKLYVHGTGLIPDIAAQFAKGLYPPAAADFRALAILERLEGIEKPKVAEIGVFAGDLSRRLLARRKDLDLTMIDSWSSEHTTPHIKSGDYHTTLSTVQQDEFFERTKKVTAFAKERSRIIRADSKAAACQIPDESLDLAFIDADHSYEGCSSDIAAYWSKVKPGGYLAGHDYADEGFAFGPMVKRAVDEFVEAAGLALELGENYTWFAVKPRKAA